MQIKFRDFINYDKRIGKMIISGDEGCGKTLLLTRIGIGKMLNGLNDCFKSFKIVDEYNKLGYQFTKRYEHLCFSNFDIKCVGTSIPNRKVYSFNPYRLGLYDKKYHTDFYPPFTLFCMTEGKNYLDAYLWDKYPQRFVSFLKTMRQARYDMVVDTQYFADICTPFRRITNRFIYLYKECEEIRDTNGLLIGHKLFVYEFSKNRDIELFERTAHKQNCIEYELIIDDVENGLYNNYDSYYCRLLHLRGRYGQDFNIKTFPVIKSVDDIEQYAEEFGFDMPEGYLKTKSTKTKDKDDVMSSLPNDDDFSQYF